MGQVIRKDKDIELKTTVDLERSTDPKIGDVYVSKSDSELYKLSEHVKTEQYDYFKVEIYDFLNREWVTCPHTLSHSSMKEYYIKVVGDVQDMIDKAINAVETGNLDEVMKDVEVPDVKNTNDDTALISTRMDQSTLIGLNDKLDMTRNLSLIHI